MSLRIAHVTATFPPYSGGTGNVCFQNARHLANNGHDVHVFTAAVGDAPKNEILEGIKVTRLSALLRSGNARLLPGLWTVLQNFDVVHLHYPFFGGEIAALAAWWRGVPLVVTYHQDVLLKGPMRLVEVVLRNTIGRAALRSANQLLFTTADYGRASYVNCMIGDRKHVIGALPNGVDTRVFTPPVSRPGTRLRLGFPPEGKIALLVAQLDRAHYFKGIDVFLEAISRLPDDVTAVIVGDGDMRPDYQRIAHELEISHRVRFAGRVSDEELPLHYQAADVTVLPSTTMGEAFGLVLVESMACGTPVIATNLPGVRDVVNPEHDGLLVTPGDVSALSQAMGRLLSDLSLRDRFGSEGRQKVEQRYDWRDICVQLENIYHSTIGTGVNLETGLVAGED